MTAIQKAYIAFYGRPADYAGQLYWAGVLDQNGGNLGAVIQAFGNSVESQALYGSSATGARIDKIYQQIFNRTADDAGKAYWAGEIDAGRTTLESAALAIMNGAANDDLTLVNRKVVAAASFTEALRAQNMSHAYTGADIAPAREYLSTITVGMSDAAINAQLATTLASIQNATWVSFNVASSTGLRYLGSTDGTAAYDGGLIFGDSGQVNWNVKKDVFLATLDDSLKPGIAAKVGSTAYGETLHGIAKGNNGGFVLWGDLDDSYNTATSNLQFVWTLNDQLQPIAAAHIGTSGGNAPTINKVITLSNGKILAVGEQNNVGDSWDAFAIVFNSDLTVHAQKRFDSPSRDGSNEEFVNAIELNNGQIVLVGRGGELIKVDQSLTQVGLGRDMDKTSIHKLANNLLLVHDYYGYRVVDSDFNVLSAFVTSAIDRMIQKAPGEFLAYSSYGYFYDVKIDVSTPTAPTMTFTDAKQLTTRSGSGVYVDKFAVNGDIVTAINNDDVFVFNISVPASPNLEADYRLYDRDLQPTLYSSSYDTLQRPDWVAADMQIVTIGTTPSMTAEQGLLLQTGSTAI